MDINFSFYIFRLKNASFYELIYRIRQCVVLYCLKFRTRFKKYPIRIPKIYIKEINKLRIPETITVSNPGLNWGIDVDKTDHEKWIKQKLPDSDIANSDIRIRWEPARLQCATYLLLFADESVTLKNRINFQLAAKFQILEWINNNPFLVGEHYASAMECAMRIPVFFYALKIIDNLSSNEINKISSAIYQHALLISQKMSLYSSVGNHTVAEAVGLVFAGAIFRKTSNGIKWLRNGIDLLNREIKRQIVDDGGPFEQSLAYHRFVLDLFWLTMDFIQRNDLGSVFSWKKRLSLGEAFINAFIDESDAFPSIGDSDNGFAIAPGIEPARQISTSDDNKFVTTFKSSGYKIIKGDRLVMTFDHGPLGMAPFFNHGHADALSITLTKNGCPMLVDPGTYRYNGVPKWRRYFKGTSAHNTVTIDSLDQAIQETSFIWSCPYNAKLIACDIGNNDLFCQAVHDGYTRLKEPVIHKRSIYFFDRSSFLIRDSFSGTGIHRFQLNFHLHPKAVVKKVGKWQRIEHKSEFIFLRLVEEDFKEIVGQEKPPFAWYSDGYGYKEPSVALTSKRTGSPNSVIFTTLIYSHLPDEIDKP